jgi:hypothetical protein
VKKGKVVRFKGYEEAIRKISATSGRQAAHDSNARDLDQGFALVSG